MKRWFKIVHYAKKKPLKTFIHSHFAGDKQCSKSSSVKSFYFMEQTSEPLAGTIPTLL